MEAKDLVLLMMIPILLIALVIYTDKNPVITGAAAYQEKQSNILGTYSILPSFKAKADYKLKEEYANIQSEAERIITQCQSAENIEQCFNQEAIRLKWNCEETNDDLKNILNDFSNKISECIALEEDNVVCRFSLDDRDLLTTSTNSFDIILTNDNLRTRVEVRQGTTSKYSYVNLENLNYINDYNNKDTLSKPSSEIKYIVEYQNRKPQVTRAVALDNANQIELSKSFLVYKLQNSIKFIEATQDGSFRSPQPANKIIDVPKFKGFKFCAKTGAKVYAYDETDNTVKQRDVVYKFAVKYSK